MEGTCSLISDIFKRKGDTLQASPLRLNIVADAESIFVNGILDSHISSLSSLVLQWK